MSNTYETLLASMREVYQQKSGIVPEDASDIGIRFQVLAGELAALYEGIKQLNQQLFPHTSTGEHLDMHAELRGIQRKPATPAKGTLFFSREQPANTDIEIPKGTLAATRQDPYEEYRTIEKSWILKGATSATVAAEAVNKGFTGNTAAGEITLLMDVLPGVSQVGNPEPFTGGIPEESDDAFRKRLVHSYQNISNSTNTAYYYDLAMERKDVEKATVIPRKRGRGTVDVVIGVADHNKEEQVCEELRRTFAFAKEINVDVSVYPAVPKEISLRLQLVVDPEFDFSVVRGRCESTIRNHMKQLDIGSPLLLSRLGRDILAEDGVENYNFLSPTKDLLTLPDEQLSLTALAIERGQPYAV